MADPFLEALVRVSRGLARLPVALLLRDAGAPHAPLWVGEGVLGLTGYPPDAFREVPGLWAERIREEDRARAGEFLRAAVREGHGAGEYRFRTARGAERWLREEVVLLPGEGRAPPRLAGFVRGAGEEARLRERLRAIEERLRRSERTEALGALAGGIAHDFNNLLTAILSTVALLQDDPAVPDDLRPDLEVIEDAARRGSALVRQILTFGGRRFGPARSVDLREVLEDLRSLLLRTLGENIRLVVKAEEGLRAARVDPAQIEQVVVNLAVNAREAMPGGGTLRIEVANARPDEVPGAGEGAYVRLSVADTGHGMPPEVRERIFEPFFSTKEGIRTGAGLGLTTVRRIVEGCGGVISVESRVGRGTAFHVHFPAEEEVAGGTAPRAPGAGVNATPPPGAARILLVEDEEVVRQAVERALIRDGHRVASVATAREALDLFDRTRPPFQLLITDVVLPDRSGPELHRALARRVGSLPVIFMSGYGGGAEGVDPDAVLAKPFDPQTLRARVAGALGWKERREKRRGNG